MQIVICGGGIIGCSTAYFLAKKGVKCTIVEKTGIACAASGKAGGFLARDWCDHYQLGPLARKSFDMHMELAEMFPQADYRRLDTLSVSVRDGKGSSKRASGDDLPSWIDESINDASSMGTTQTTAQVHPFKLSRALFETAKETVGTDVVMGTVKGIEKDGDKVTGVKIDSDVIPADVVVIAMGPWSGQASKWLKIPRISGKRAHSIIMKPDAEISPHALFVDYSPVTGKHRSPEIYPRPDGTVYCCGNSDQEPLPVDPADVTFNQNSLDDLKTVVGKVSSALITAEIETKQACYLPCSIDGLPVIGKVPGTEGAFVATGHTCWGILNAPATGAVMADIIIDGTTSLVDVSDFSPARF